MSAFGTKQTSILTLNMSLSGAKRTSLIGWPMSANDPRRTLAATPDLVCVGADPIVCECLRVNCTIQLVQLDLFHFSAFGLVSAQIYRKI